MADLKISQLTGATTPLTGAEVLPVVQSSTTKQVSVANLTAGRAVATGNLTTTGTSAFTVNTVNTAGLTGTNSSNSAYFSLGVSGATGFGVANWANSTVFESVPASGGGLVVGSFSGNVNFQVARVTYLSLSNTALTFTATNLVQGTAARGINFTANTPAAGMTSQLLNWYEEGTWVFTLFDAATGGNASATTATGYYTRVGRVVTCTVNLVTNIDTTGMTAGNRLWFSLPFSTSLSGSGSAQLSQFVFGASAFVTPVVTNASRGFFAITTNNNTTNNIIVSNLTSGQSDIQYLTLTYQI